MQCAPEVLHVPLQETLLYDLKIGLRYLATLHGYQHRAGHYAAENADWTGVCDKRFHEIMFETCYTRNLRPLSDTARAELETRVAEDKPGFGYDPDRRYGSYNFTAMNLLEPLPGTFCAPTRLIYEEDPETKARRCRQIVVDGVAIYPRDSSWGLAKIYALQGAAYHALFVTHPALHFPFDSVNAITKSAVPMGHPLFQLLFPHTAYSLALDHAVLESAQSLVNNDAHGTRYDPMTANGYNLKLLFGAGYAGLEGGIYDDGYPAFDYMRPQMGFDSDYGRWLEDYYENAILPLCRVVAELVCGHRGLFEYAKRWADYNAVHVLGFPDGKAVKDADVLARALAIFIWDVSVAHGGDHDSFGNFITSVEKCLRIRRPPPARRDEPEVRPRELFTANDLHRASLADEMFFKPWAIEPYLKDTRYAFTDPTLRAAVDKFHDDLEEVAGRWHRPRMPLHPDPEDNDPLYPAEARVLPQSVQY